MRRSLPDLIRLAWVWFRTLGDRVFLAPNYHRHFVDVWHGSKIIEDLVYRGEGHASMRRQAVFPRAYGLLLSGYERDNLYALLKTIVAAKHDSPASIFHSGDWTMQLIYLLECGGNSRDSYDHAPNRTPEEYAIELERWVLVDRA